MQRIALILLLVFQVTNTYADNALIATAANFTNTAKTLKQAFEQSHNHKLKLSFGSTGKLYAQIVNGAPYDVFLSADSERPVRLESDGTGVKDTRITYALGQLVLWSQSTDVEKIGLSNTLLSDLKRFAIANPNTAPYGRAAKESLQALKLYQTFQGKLVLGESVSQAFQFIATANAGAGLIAKAQLNQWAGPKGYQWLVPPEYYQPIEQQAVLLARAKDNKAARAFIEFLISPKARNIIMQQGYALPNILNNN